MATCTEYIGQLDTDLGRMMRPWTVGFPREHSYVPGQISDDTQCSREHSHTAVSRVHRTRWGLLLSRRGRGSPANASASDTHRDSIMFGVGWPVDNTLMARRRAVPCHHRRGWLLGPGLLRHLGGAALGNRGDRTGPDEPGYAGRTPDRG
jgi:hypothetical protein